MATPYHLPKKKGVIKGTGVSFFRDTFVGLSQWRLHWGCRGLSFILDLIDQICTFVLDDIVVVCLFMFDGMLHNIVVYDILLFVLIVKIFS